MKTLAARIFAILLLATVFIQVLSFGGVVAFGARESRRQMYDFMAADLAFIHRFLGSLAPERRQAWMSDLGRGYYSLELMPTATHLAESDHPLLLPVASTVRRALGTRARVLPVLLDAGTSPAIAVSLDEHHTLVVRLPARPPFSPPPAGVIAVYLGFVTLGVMLVAWFAVRLATRPLQRFAAAAHALAENLDAPPLPERGPTEVAQATQAFNAMQAALQRNLAERTRILASISHDLKTPLTRLRLRVAAFAPEAERDRAEDDIDDMDALIQEGLDYARSEHIDEARVPSDLNAMVDSIAEQAEDLGCHIAVRGQPAAAVVCAPRAIRRALQNLADNACKYAREIEIHVAERQQRIEIRVEDRGPGIPSALLERVFEPFFRIEDSRNRQTGGTGLGLTIARNLIHAQGGKLRLENRAGGGLSAIVSLPRDAS